VAPKADIVINGTVLGAIEFDDNPYHLPCQRAAKGFRLTVPAEVVLPGWTGPKDLRGVVRRLYCRLMAIHPGGNLLELGEARSPRVFTPSPEGRRTPADLSWSGGLSVLAAFEEIRKGGPALLEMQVQGEHFHTVPLHDDPAPLSATEPTVFAARAGLRYPAETWSKMLEALGVVADIHLSVPLPTEPARSPAR